MGTSGRMAEASCSSSAMSMVSGYNLVLGYQGDVLTRKTCCSFLQAPRMPADQVHIARLGNNGCAVSEIKKIFHFRRAGENIGGDDDAADFSKGKEAEKIFGRIHQMDGNLVAFFNAAAQQDIGIPVDHFIKAR